MDLSGTVSVENGKQRFADAVKLRAAYNEKHRVIADSIHALRLEIEGCDGCISQTIDELAKSIFMSAAKKNKKCAHIDELKQKKQRCLQKIAGCEEQIRALKLEMFGTEYTPRIFFGRYAVGLEDEASPLEWDVMRVSSDRALLLCNDIIEKMPYAKELANTPWKESVIRKWTNGEFFEKAFSEKERELIVETEIANPGNSVYKTASSSNTRDFVFIPSVKDARRFYNYDSDRKAKPTPHAAREGVYVDEKTGCAYWWLRSNGGNLYNAAVVNFNGYVFEYGFYVNSEEYGVRPALWIKIS